MLVVTLETETGEISATWRGGDPYQKLRMLAQLAYHVERTAAEEEKGEILVPDNRIVVP